MDSILFFLVSNFIVSKSIDKLWLLIGAAYRLAAASLSFYRSAVVDLINCYIARAVGVAAASTILEVKSSFLLLWITI